jgi:hypothetical protein
VSLDAWLERIDPPRGTLAHGVWRTLLVAFTIAGVCMTYYPASAFTAARSVDMMTRLDHAIPFVPWTWWIYFPHYVLGLVITSIVVRDVRIMFRVIAAVLLGQLISLGFYLTIPSTFPRPMGVGDADPLTAAALAWFWGADPANNTFPSTHVANSCIAALGAWRSGQRVRWYMTLVALGVFVTVHTTKQHYWVDAVGGVVLAVVAYNLVLRAWPLSEGSPREDQDEDLDPYPSGQPAPPVA